MRIFLFIRFIFVETDKCPDLCHMNIRKEREEKIIIVGVKERLILLKDKNFKEFFIDITFITNKAIKNRMSKTNIYALFCRRYFCLLNPVIIPDSEITLTVAVESTT